ncbi:NAD(P)H-binding protein [Actinomycetospora endophytica]|uniref:NAD(P)H-binding protein n=1 Tax=Actinomycetospora endophytica TaxID=2291215 RepID=A0ABS8P9F8_9PSEU|nr:NAD(P)H-binding protein [Actinomycetospora endophytica]MCD2194920.1 NAD(P)H-binding protein [Actinomycetospora endophytica]
MTTVVIGARGAVGRHVVEGLLAGGEHVRASVRNLATADFPAAVEVVQADLADPDSITRALAGADRLFLYAPEKGAAGVAETIRRAGTGHVVVLSSGSVLLPWAVAGNAIAAEHDEMERALAGCAPRVTPIRPLVLAGNALNWARSIRRDRTVELVHPESRSAPVHEADIAAIAVAALTGSAAADPSGLLTGPEVLTQRRQAELIGEALGEPIHVEEIDEHRAREKFGAAGDPATVDAILAFIARNRRDGESPATPVAREVLGREPLSFARWARDHVGDFR